MTEQENQKDLKDTQTSNDCTLEEAFAQVEEVIRHMEEPDISLGDSLAEYERGIGLLKFCNDQIDRVEKQMITLRAGFEAQED